MHALITTYCEWTSMYSTLQYAWRAWPGLRQYALCRGINILRISIFFVNQNFKKIQKQAPLMISCKSASYEALMLHMKHFSGSMFKWMLQTL